MYESFATSIEFFRRRWGRTITLVPSNRGVRLTILSWRSVVVIMAVVLSAFLTVFSYHCGCLSLYVDRTIMRDVVSQVFLLSAPMNMAVIA
jgi:hypothetical protein